MVTQKQNHIPYIPAIDGIRAIAIVAVLLFHVWPVALSGGFTGVDVFFVLSGFLIAAIILTDLRGGGFSMQEFYLRRVQRLLPNLVGMVVAVLLLWRLFLPPSSARQLAIHSIWTIFNLSNFYIWKYLGGYWESAAERAPLTHTWSLGIEEQFYLLFPGLLLLLSRFYPSRLITWLTIIMILSFGICLYGTYTHPVATFYFMPTRVWELLLGAVLAANRTPLRRPQSHPWASFRARFREVIGWSGLSMIVLGFIFINGDNLFPGVVCLFPTVGTALLLAAVVGGETAVARLLSTPFMVRTGKLSYSFYIWHWPLIILGRIQADLYGFPELAGSLIGGLIGIMMGWTAYYGIERPLRKRGRGRVWRLIIIAGGVSGAAIWSGIIGSRPVVIDTANVFDKQTFSIGLYDAGRNAGLSEAQASVPYLDIHFPTLPPRPIDAWRAGGIVHLYGVGAPKIMVFGSSHALMYSKLIDDICREMKISVAFFGVGDGTRLFFEATVNPNFPSKTEAREFDSARIEFLQRWRPIAVFAIDRWDKSFNGRETFDSKLRKFLIQVSPFSHRVIFVTQIPVARVGDINLRDFVTWQMRKGKNLPRLIPDSGEIHRQQAVGIAEKAYADFPNLRILRADSLFYYEDGSIRYSEGRKFFYVDDNHLSDSGAEQVRRLIQEAITEARASGSTG